MAEDVTPETIAMLARQAGLNLPSHMQEELVGAYGNVRRLLATIPSVRPRGDEPAHVFVPRSFQAEEK